MLKRVTVLLIAALFCFSVAGLSYAQTKPGDERKAAEMPTRVTPAAKPGDTPAAKSPVNPCAVVGEKEMGKKKGKKKTDALKAQKAECLKKATTDQAKAECEKKFAEKPKPAKKKTTKKKMGEVPGAVEK